MTTTQTNETPVLKIERVFNATPERLWTFWTDPKKYAKWFNPAPIDLVIHEFDVREGGRVRFDMPQPDGNKNPQEGVFHKLDPYKEIVSGDADKSFMVRVQFIPMGRDQTRMVVTVTGLPSQWHAPATVGWNQGFDHLERDLGAGKAIAPGPDVSRGFTIERTFRAKPEKVWAMWATKEGIEKWWVVSARDMGYDMRVLKMDVRVGGTFAFEMKHPDHTIVNGGTYNTVEPHRKLAWTWHFDIFLAPGEKPYDVPISVTLEPTPSGGTKMTFKEGPLATPEHTEGSRQGVLSNIAKMAEALGEN